MKKLAFVLATVGSAFAVNASALGSAYLTIFGTSASTVYSSVTSSMEPAEKQAVQQAKPAAKAYLSSPNSMDKKDLQEAIEIVKKYQKELSDEQAIEMIAE